MKRNVLLISAVLLAQSSFAGSDNWKFLYEDDDYCSQWQSLAWSLHAKQVERHPGNLEAFAGMSWDELPEIKPTGDRLVFVKTISYGPTFRPRYRAAVYSLNGIVYTVGIEPDFETDDDEAKLTAGRAAVIETRDSSFVFKGLRAGDRISAADYPDLEQVAGLKHIYRFGDSDWCMELDRRTDRILRFVRYKDHDSQRERSAFIDRVMIENKKK